MGIIPVEMYTAECDNCGVHAEFGDFSCYGDKDRVREDCDTQGWHFVDYNNGKCYCEDCWQYDDNDNLVIKNKF